ncbi:ribosome-inactivating family protein [Streptomyces sp. CB02400]|uniref:ribosome-inactivating family protein n=1 Tax=Streptomyces sp. CB02400 TaxID=1703944 RepID=UPI00093CC1E4|nr:ribosome-inactivating family protein [Streptomyces sp. CB02400]OKK05041.1 hypothetical protein AMK33_22805 [Streptomyces sp. CB02400]
MNFGGNYGSLIDAAGGEPEIANLDGLRGAVRGLASIPDLATANGSQRQSAARALLLFVGAFSEAARFTDFRDAWDPVFAGRSGGSFYTVSSPYLRSLRNAWGPISRFAVAITDNPSTFPLLVDGVGQFSFRQDVRDHLRVIRR